MSRPWVFLLGLALVVAGCSAGRDDEAARIAELEAEVAELRESLADAKDDTTEQDVAAPEEQPPPATDDESSPPPEDDDASPPPADGSDEEAAAAPSEAAPTTVYDLSRQRGFQTPSGNIACLGADYGRGPYLQCEIGSQLNPPPDVVCDFDWTGATMSGTGSASPLCASDTMRGELGADPEVLAYGETWVAGPFTCSSEDTGLTCTNGDGGRLFLSRARWEAN